MPLSRRFKVNTPTVAWEAVDGEVIVINLATGTYYSLEAAGALLWERLASGATLGECAVAVGRHYEAEEEVIQRALEQLVADLRAEDLVVPASDTEEARPQPAEGSVAAPAADGEREPFVEPKLERYIDLQNLIQLDPILAVDERGWPVAERP